MVIILNRFGIENVLLCKRSILCIVSLAFVKNNLIILLFVRLDIEVM